MCRRKVTTQNLGDIRELRIHFEPTLLPTYNTWKITDVYTGQDTTFNKNNQGLGGFVYMGATEGTMGYFNPGEGKLFKLTPVVQSGGILLAMKL